MVSCMDKEKETMIFLMKCLILKKFKKRITTLRKRITLDESRVSWKINNFNFTSLGGCYYTLLYFMMNQPKWNKYTREQLFIWIAV